MSHATVPATASTCTVRIYAASLASSPCTLVLVFTPTNTRAHTSRVNGCLVRHDLPSLAMLPSSDVHRHSIWLAALRNACQASATASNCIQGVQQAIQALEAGGSRLESSYHPSSIPVMSCPSVSAGGHAHKCRHWVQPDTGWHS